MIPYGRQSISSSDIAAVSEVLKSDYLTTGPVVEEFENCFASMVGAKHAVAVCNGTAALHLAMVVAGIGAGDRVTTSPNTFLSSANCAVFAGATPDFSDIDPISYSLCPDALADGWKEDTRAVVAVDYGGQTAEMPRIAEVARSRGAIVIEDACHAVGGRFGHDGHDYSIGGHPWADLTTFSFHPVKTMTTGEGGMLVTDFADLADRARCLRSHGMVREADQFVGLGTNGPGERGPWYYEMQSLGFNYRITDLQCSLGLSQLERLSEFAARRRDIVESYNAAFRDCDNIDIPQLRNERDRAQTSWHLYTVQIDFANLGKTRTRFMQELKERGVGSQVLYIPVYLQPWYRKNFGYSAGKCPIAEAYYQRTLSLPLYSGMTDGDVRHVIETVTALVESVA